MPQTDGYLSERVSYGGEWMTRGEMIADLQRVARLSGHPNPQAIVDRYLQGFDRQHAIQRRIDR